MWSIILYAFCTKFVAKCENFRGNCFLIKWTDKVPLKCNTIYALVKFEEIKYKSNIYIKIC